mmetsp:Transcript_23668/g.47067  ORF Transcript_23668/g.47067 Transcript_23668/m.47067 type:complete len:84 (+) Transcript_23668:102-353(+)
MHFAFFVGGNSHFTLQIEELLQFRRMLLHHYRSIATPYYRTQRIQLLLLTSSTRSISCRVILNARLVDSFPPVWTSILFTDAI